MNEADFAAAAIQGTPAGGQFMYPQFMVWTSAFRATSISCNPGGHYCSETFGLGGTYPTKVDCEVLCGGSSTSLASIYLDGSSSSSNSRKELKDRKAALVSNSTFPLNLSENNFGN